MGEHQMDMSSEEAPKRKKLLEEGWRKFVIVSCEPEISTKGNDMFVIRLKDVETEYVETIYAISAKGKRWMLKAILTACGVPAGADGVYDWSTSDIINKGVEALNEHEENKWIDRDGNDRCTKQNRLVEFAEQDANIAWDE